jgi:hypothetical protein
MIDGARQTRRAAVLGFTALETRPESTGRDMESYFSTTPQHRPCGCSFRFLVYNCTRGQLERDNDTGLRRPILVCVWELPAWKRKPQSTIGVCTRTACHGRKFDGRYGGHSRGNNAGPDFYSGSEVCLIFCCSVILIPLDPFFVLI